jgi:small-conductance mechanosensitive channel
VQTARGQLRRFRQASLLAVALTGLLLLLFAPDIAAQEPDREPATMSAQDIAAPDEPDEELAIPEGVARATRQEARETVRGLAGALYASLPRLLVAVGILLLVWLVNRLIRLGLAAVLPGNIRRPATAALLEIALWILAAGLAISVVAGDIRAALGSVGLAGLALSWALQTPIESFTGWLLNSFRGYYRVGDRVAVGEIFGDVFRIDFLTTTVWEIGGPERGVFVNAEQPTGRIITFPNNEVLAGSVVNLTRDYPYVWDELAYPVANESDLRHSLKVLQTVAAGIFGESMAGPALEYERILSQAGLQVSVSPAPETYLALEESWTTVIIRYLVDARQRRKWKTELILQINDAVSQPEHEGRIIPVLPRQQLQLIDREGLPRAWPS